MPNFPQFGEIVQPAIPDGFVPDQPTTTFITPEMARTELARRELDIQSVSTSKLSPIDRVVALEVLGIIFLLILAILLRNKIKGAWYWSLARPTNLTVWQRVKFAIAREWIALIFFVLFGLIIGILFFAISNSDDYLFVGPSIGFELYLAFTFIRSIVWAVRATTARNKNS